MTCPPIDGLQGTVTREMPHRVRRSRSSVEEAGAATIIITLRPKESLHICHNPYRSRKEEATI